MTGYLLLILLSMVGSMTASFNNRFLPVYPPIYTRTVENPSTVYFAPMFIRTAHARNWLGDTIPLQDLYARYRPAARAGYDLAYVNEALANVGKINTAFPSEYSGINELYFGSNGEIHAEGFQFALEYAVHDNISFGLITSLLHVSSSLDFFIHPRLREVLKIPVPNVTMQGREREIYNAFLNAFSLLDLDAPEWSATGFGDSDIYVRFGKRIDYRYKFRRIDVGVRLGGIVPTNVALDFSNPAAISLGGGGFAGFFAQPEFELELKQDWVFGMWARVEARAKRTFTARVPVQHLIASHQEPINFGAIVGDFRIRPGVTVGFSPYFSLMDLFDGLGAQVQYVYVHHARDYWVDVREDKTFRPDLNAVNDLSTWTDSHVGVTVFLELNKTKLGYRRAPEYFITVLAPVNILGASNVGKSLRINLGFEFNF